VILQIVASALFQVAARPTPAPTPTPVPGEVRVTVTVYGPDQKKSLGAGAVVWIPGAKPVGPHAAAKPQLASQNKRFTPRVLAVPVGTTVDFPNLDRIHHNVFSLSEKAKFDLGLYKNGASKPWKFEQPGVVRIFCNIHPQMAAFVMVVDGEVYATAGPDGVAVLTNVPPGKKSVKVWDERGGEWSGTVDVAAGRSVPIAVTLDGSAFREAPHKNKYGKDYPPPDDDENRY
jgi:plastocyanin